MMARFVASQRGCTHRCRTSSSDHRNHPAHQKHCHMLHVLDVWLKQHLNFGVSQFFFSEADAMNVSAVFGIAYSRCFGFEKVGPGGCLFSFSVGTWTYLHKAILE